MHRRLSAYAKVFDEEGALDKPEAFALLKGPAHYQLPPNKGTITLERVSWVAPEETRVGLEERALVYRGGETIGWKFTKVL